VLGSPAATPTIGRLVGVVPSALIAVAARIGSTRPVAATLRAE